MNRRSVLTALTLLTTSCATASHPEQTVEIQLLDAKDGPPPTAEELHEGRIRAFLNEAKFVGTVGVSSDPQHFSTTDTIPIPRKTRNDPPGSSLRDAPFVGEILRVDQELMKGDLPLPATPSIPPDRLAEGPVFGPDRQFDFTMRFSGCEAPTRLMGSVSGLGSRRLVNLMMPERKIAVVLSVEDAEFDLGNLRSGTGFIHDFLDLVACT